MDADKVAVHVDVDVDADVDVDVDEVVEDLKEPARTTGGRSPAPEYHKG